MSLTETEILKLKNTNIIELAMFLEDGLINACFLDENMSVFELIKIYLFEK